MPAGLRGAVSGRNNRQAHAAGMRRATLVGIGIRRMTRITALIRNARGLPAVAICAVGLLLAASCSGGAAPPGGPGDGSDSRPAAQTDGPPARPASGPGAARNIVIVCVNCLRKDHVGVYAPSAHTPHMDAFAESGAYVFDGLISPATWTAPCLFELLTARDWLSVPNCALEPLPHGTVVTAPEKTTPETLLSAPAIRAWGGPDYTCLWVFVRRLHDLLAIDQVKALKPPFALFVHATTLHYPYASADGSIDPRTADLGDAPADVEKHYIDSMDTQARRTRIRDESVLTSLPFLLLAFGPTTWADTPLGRKYGIHYGWMLNERVVESWRRSPHYALEIDILRRLYRANVGTVDAGFGEVLGFLEKRGQRENTIVVLIGDHGEHFMEHGVLGHSLPYDNLINPPLILKVPGAVDRKVVVRDQVRDRDLLPTVLELAGLGSVARARAAIHGRSLVPLLAGKRRPITVFSRSLATAVSVRRNDGWKLIWRKKQDKREVYNTRTDPTESNNLVGKRPDIEGPLAEDLLLHVYARP